MEEEEEEGSLHWYWLAPSCSNGLCSSVRVGSLTVLCYSDITLPSLLTPSIDDCPIALNSEF